MKQLTNKMIIPNAIKYWIEPTKQGHEIRVLDDNESVFVIELRGTREHNEVYIASSHEME